MSNLKNEQNGKGRTRQEEIEHLIERKDWDGLGRYLGFPPLTPEEVERILATEPMVDAAAVNRIMEELDRAYDEQSARTSERA
jgi:hypothetical protein